MKKFAMVSVLLTVLSLAMPKTALAEYIHISTGTTSLVLDATENQPLKFVYYGGSLSAADLATLESAGAPMLNAYPVYGMDTQHETAMSVTHFDGNMTLDMAVRGVTKTTPADGGELVTVKMSDRFYAFDINVCYLTRPGSEIIETWAEAVNREKGNVVLREFASAYLPVRYGDVWVTQFYGSWANEARMEESALTHGMKVVKNRDGVRNSQMSHAEIMLSLDGKPHENTGRVIGAALCYSGNYELRIDTDNYNYHHVFAGINPDNSSYTMKRGETFVTPALAITYSAEGKGGVSRNYHRWARKYMIAHGDKERKILLNSWEGVYFKINEDGMRSMMSDIASMGGELFVMDDGWFGEKYPRNNGSTSLGDWMVDTNKLPHGIQGLIDTAADNGIKFGIWIEPEMSNIKSELYEKHPEYIIKPSNREPVTGRGGTQVVLDLSNPKVQDIVFTVVDTLLQSYPGIDYIKWDANMPISNHGSQYLTADNQSHLHIEYHRGLAKALDRIRAKYPDVTIQACASGGGRANYGVMPWFDEFWVSDNTDALQRVYLQWGISHFFPTIAMASHISAAPNHQTHRTVPLKYRIDVAMSGRLGMEIQPKLFTEAEKKMCRKAIEEYKQVRSTVQMGDLYRLMSPYDRRGVASLMYVNPEKTDAVFFWWKTESFAKEQLPLVAMAGLDPNKNYRVVELNRIDKTPLSVEGKVFTGRFLMEHGLEMPGSHDASPQTDYSSRVLRLVAE